MTNGNPRFRTRPGSVIRYGKWKLYHYFGDNGLDPYNLDENMGELNNLVDIEVDKANEVLKILNQWRKDTNAPKSAILNR